MNFEHKFILDREHFTECFEQSEFLRPQGLKRYTKAIIMFALGFFISAANIEKLSGHLGYFFYILGVVEILSVRFARGWWVTRQMFSKASGSEVTLTLSQEGIQTKSDFVDSFLTWSDIERSQTTDKGIIVFIRSGGNSYISRSVLNDESYQFLIDKTS